MENDIRIAKTSLKDAREVKGYILVFYNVNYAPSKAQVVEFHVFNHSSSAKAVHSKTSKRISVMALKQSKFSFRMRNERGFTDNFHHDDVLIFES
jgi:hypothetical protein